jgi:hypothetical protein
MAQLVADSGRSNFPWMPRDAATATWIVCDLVTSSVVASSVTLFCLLARLLRLLVFELCARCATASLADSYSSVAEKVRFVTGTSPSSLRIAVLKLTSRVCPETETERLTINTKTVFHNAVVEGSSVFNSLLCTMLLLGLTLLLHVQFIQAAPAHHFWSVVAVLGVWTALSCVLTRMLASLNEGVDLLTQTTAVSLQMLVPPRHAGLLLQYMATCKSGWCVAGFRVSHSTQVLHCLCAFTVISYSAKRLNGV